MGMGECMPAEGSAKAIRNSTPPPPNGRLQSHSRLVEWLQTWTQVLIAEVLTALEPTDSRDRSNRKSSSYE